MHFTPNFDGNLSSIVLRLRSTNLGFNDGNMYVAIEYASDLHVPNGTVLEISSAVQVSTLTTTLADVIFVFSGDIEVYDDTEYAFYCFVNGSTTLGIMGSLYSQYSASSSSFSYKGGVGWLSYSLQGIYYLLYADDGSGSTPTPVPSSTSTSGTGSYNLLDNDLVLFIMALFFIFIPPMLVLISCPKVGMAGFMLVLAGCAALGVAYLDLPFYFLVFAALGIGIMFFTLLKRS